MGEPASGGSVRMLEEDIAWMKENLTIGSLIVIY
jgi:lipoprotein-anchoring transpeptidase ErfK/SrfK